MLSIRTLFDRLDLQQKIEEEVGDLLKKGKQLNQRLQAVADGITLDQAQHLATIRKRIDAAKTSMAEGVKAGDRRVKRVGRDDDSDPRPMSSRWGESASGF
jgi:hypothetical protein